MTRYEIAYFNEDVRDELVECKTKSFINYALTIPLGIMTLSAISPISGAILGGSCVIKGTGLMISGNKQDKILGFWTALSGIIVGLGSFFAPIIPIALGLGAMGYFKNISLIYYIKSNQLAKMYGLDLLDVQREEIVMQSNIAREIREMQLKLN